MKYASRYAALVRSGSSGKQNFQFANKLGIFFKNCIIDKTQLFLQADHNKIRHTFLAKHLSQIRDIYDTFIEYVYHNATYSMNNHLDLNNKEMNMELHLDR